MMNNTKTKHSHKSNLIKRTLLFASAATLCIALQPIAMADTNQDNCKALISDKPLIVNITSDAAPTPSGLDKYTQDAKLFVTYSCCQYSTIDAATCTKNSVDQLFQAAKLQAALKAQAQIAGSTPTPPAA